MARSGSAAFFDLDKTIIATSSSTAFSRSFLQQGLMSRTDALRTAYAQLLFQIGGADARQTNRMRDAISNLVQGWEVAKVNAIVAETIHEHIDPVVYQEALALIKQHQANGRDVVIVSASGAEVVAPIAELLGAESWLATTMEIKNGRYTGEITFYCYGQAKADAVQKLAAERGYDLRRCYAYSDSLTDAPLLNLVGHGFAVNPDRHMRRAAIRNGWGVLRFRKPVALREAMSTGSAALTGVVLLGITLTALWFWRRMHRSRSTLV